MMQLRRWRRPQILILLILSYCSIGFAQTDKLLFKQSISAFMAHDYASSEGLLLSLVKTNPNNTLYWFNLGNSYYMQAKFDLAIDAFQKVVELKGNLAPAAQFYWAKTLLAANRKKEAIQKLESLLKVKLPPSLKEQVTNDLNKLNRESENDAEIKIQALHLYQTGKFQSSIDMNKSLKDQGDPESLLLEGMAFAKLGRSRDAKSLFEKSAHLNSAPELSKSAQNLLEQMSARALQENPYWLFFDLAAGGDSNIFLDGKSISPVSSIILKGTMGVGSRIYKEGFYDCKLAYMFNWDEVTQASSLRIQTHSVSAPITYLAGATTIYFGPYYQYQVWSQTPALSKLGFRVKWNQNWIWADAGVDSDISAQNNLNSDYSYLGGNSQLLRFYAGIFGENIYGQIAYEIGSENIGDLVYSNGLLPLSNRFSGPSMKLIWKGSNDLVYNLAIGNLRRSYRTPAQPGSKSRTDNAWTISAKASQMLNHLTTIYALIEESATTSTLGSSDISDKNINDTRALIGVTWDLL